LEEHVLLLREQPPGPEELTEKYLPGYLQGYVGKSSDVYQQLIDGAWSSGSVTVIYKEIDCI